MTKRLVLIIGVSLSLLMGCSVLSRQNKMKNYVLFRTDMGEFVVGLYETTPMHRDNFLDLCKSHYYDSLLIHKTVPSGMIVTGDSASRNASKDKTFNDKPTDTVIPAEFNENLFHRRGAVGAVRADDKINLAKKSHPQLFYVVYGEKFDDKSLNRIVTKRNAPIVGKYVNAYLDKPGNEALRDSLNYYQTNRMNEDYRRLYISVTQLVTPLIEQDKVSLFGISDAKRKIYSSEGGLPDMDGDFTIFGYTVYGLENIEKMTKEKTGLRFRPRNDIYILSTQVMNKKEWKNFIKEHKK